MKQNKKAKICFVIYIAGFFFFKFLCYEVIAKQKKKKCSANHYCRSSQRNLQQADTVWGLGLGLGV
jgi:hypothetical protein